MEFWGVEVKPNQTVKCEPGDDKLLHLSLAALAEAKKSSENVTLYVTFNNQKLVIGTLSAEKCPHINHDLIFEKEFELSHNSKNATVHFTGYKSIQNDDDPSDFDISSEEEEEEEAKVASKTNGTIRATLDELKKNVAEKAKAGKPIKPEEKAGEDSDDEEDSDDDDEDMADSDNSDGEEDESDDEEEDDDDSSEEEEETPEPAKGKKRPAEVAKKANESEKKAKLSTPADGKKGGEAKKGTTTPAKSEKSDKGKQQTPKSAGSVSCKSCSKTFNSGGALESHTKAKHAAK